MIELQAPKLPTSCVLCGRPFRKEALQIMREAPTILPICALCMPHRPPDHCLKCERAKSQYRALQRKARRPTE